MPGFTTHYILGLKAYGGLESSGLKYIISKYRWLYQLGLQGPDMFFYNIPILRHRDYRNVGSYMHESHVNDFFANALCEIQSMDSKQKQQQAISYIAGFLCHYVGDYICHPYIYARIGHERGKNSAYVYGLHAALENDIDTLLLKKYKKKKTSEFNQAATLALNGFEIQFVSDFLCRIINKTYYPITYKNNFRVTSAMVHRSVLAMRFGVRTLADPTGRKKGRINAIESIFLKAPIVSQKILSDEMPDINKVFNLKHELWINPWNNSIYSKESFTELFEKCISRCEEIFKILNTEIMPDRLEETDFHRLLGNIGNFSYHSGLDVGSD
ncbi:zinc dependent phospholipase C family protein [Lachnoanaerobaculum umeaense]|uniref:Phospholipase n=1 Tax=Lachnoanaerobaculum umeaense TaxID=617123 RepID=A0A385PX33_9FIRM|nr:zinc dependent phospholipase C family protein [Lachnoanaerobaculum umeaense]AYA98536.1 phospholipase [Lachnoanaerobaculum umeaense]PZW97801.1 zinc dependent phospholipase C [Lachnoanaerobaculum umeaense]